jgi:hypothetical protein
MSGNDIAQARHQSAAGERYRRELNKAQMADLLNRISGDNTDLIKFDEVANRLRTRQRIEMGTEMVPLTKIVGSVGRYKDFTRTFLPRSGANKARWTNIDAAMNSLEGLPAVELYKIGDAYFVRDGNHRVSVARANDVSHIEAYVTEYQTSIPLTADDFERDQWLIKIEHAEFLAKTNLDQLRSDSLIELTEPGRFRILLRHIHVHRYLRNLDLERIGADYRLTWEDAVESWYDNVYMPMVHAIREQNLLVDFPKRTEADLYLWVAHQRERIAQQYGLAPLSPEASVATFAETHSDRPLNRTVKGIKQGLHWALGPDDRPLGLSEEEYNDARARHDAGEISLAEAEEIIEHDAQDSGRPEGHVPEGDELEKSELDAGQ